MISNPVLASSAPIAPVADVRTRLCWSWRNAARQDRGSSRQIGAALGFIAAVLLAGLLAGIPGLARLSSPAHGAVNGSSYVTPFPKNDVYEVKVYGDYFAEGLAYGLGVSFKDDKRVRTSGTYRRIRGVVRASFAADLKRIADELTANPVPIAVIMMGGSDRASIRDPKGYRIRLSSPSWRRAYGARIDKLIKVFKSKGAAVYWVGLPIMRGSKTNAHAKLINEIVRERVYLNGAKFIDVYSAFVTEDGNYDRFGPDLSGKIRKLRNRDGETFTAAGNRKLAHFVVREIKRDLVQAKAERAVPLAGNETEQRRINPEQSNAAEALKGWSGNVKLAPGATRKGARARNTRRIRRGSREQRADNSKISIKIVGPQGEVKTVSVKILRPAIPAAVIALVTRKQSADRAAQIGDSVPGILQGGLTILSSITPVRNSATGAGVRRLPPTHTSYYRGLIKGELLPPKPGRSDDFSWPRIGTKAASGPSNKGPRAQAPTLSASQPRG